MVSVRPAGRLGNFLYESSACIAYSLRHDMGYCIPHHNYDYFRFFNKIKVCHNYPSGFVYAEPSHGYNEIPYFENIILQGYFQSWKYFNDFKEDVLSLYGFNYEPKEGWVGLHNRLGDYKQYADRHYNLSDEDIKSAINIFLAKGYTKFLVFSDGMDETRLRINSSVYPDCYFEYSEGLNEFEDMQLMSNCEHQITSASTFSIWANILNKNQNKICVSPKTWFLGQNAHLESKDIYPENCIKI